MDTSRTLTVALVLISIALAGCGSDETNKSGQATSVVTAPAGDGNRQTGGATQKRPCPNPHGGRCLGPLDPGTYTTQSFSPAITYTVSAGWTNGEDLNGNFLLGLADDMRYIGIYRDANAPYKCEEHPDADVGQSVRDYTRWLRSNTLLHVTKPRPVSVGGLNGVVMDISKARGAEGKGCTFDTLEGNVPFIIGGRGPASLHHVITDAPGWKERFYLLRYRHGNVAIEISPEGDSLNEYMQKVTPLLRALRFGKG